MEEGAEMKAPTVLFLGAGASAPIGFPTTKEIIEEIGIKPYNKDKLREKLNIGPKEAELLRRICEGPKLEKGLKIKLKDMEDLLEYFDIALNPYNSLCIEILSEEVRDTIAATASKIFDIADEDKKRYKEIYNQIEEYLVECYAYTEEYDEKIERFYGELISSLINEKFFPDDAVLPIFTTNYDQVLEKLSEKGIIKNNYVFMDGFLEKGGEHVFSDAYHHKGQRKPEKPVIELFKLHGGLTWHVRKRDNRIIRSERIETIIYPDKRYKSYPEIIRFAKHGPYEKEEFYILHRHLREYLEKANRCIVIGFSFRDIGRINRIFEDVMRYDNKNLELIISNRKDKQDEGLSDETCKERFIEGLDNVTKSWFNEFDDRIAYFDGGIEKLPEKLRGLKED